MRPGEHGEADPGPPAFEVVFICTANRARSPFAAARMRRHLAGLPVAVESFGTMEQAGVPALVGAVRAAYEFGIDLSRHRARPLRPGRLDGTTVVIGFEPFHVAAAVVVGGARRSRTFLITELADALEDPGLSERASDPSLDTLVALCDAHRRGRRGLPTSIADPVGVSDRRVLEIFHKIDRLLSVVATRLVSAGIQRPG